MDPELQRILVFGVLSIAAVVSTVVVIVWAVVGQAILKNWKEVNKSLRKGKG